MTNSIADIPKADVILITGSNTTEAHPVLALEIISAVKNGAKLIVIEPRRIKMADYADIYISQKPGTDVELYNAMMNVIITEGLTDKDFIKARTEDFDALEKTLKKYTPEKASKICGVPADTIVEAARLYAKAGAATIIYAMGITQHTTGVDNVLTMANLAMMTGNIGREGTGVNPLRGQNNVQGACDMGALPNVLPGYVRVDDKDGRKKMEEAWGVKKLPDKPGLTAPEMIDAAANGDIKAMFILGENPMLSEANLVHTEIGLGNLDLLVVQDIFMTETANLADVVLPGASFAEKSGTFTNTERRVQPIRQAVEPVGSALPDWMIITMIAKRLGHKMEYRSPSEVTDEITHVVSQYGGITSHRVAKCGISWPCPTPEHPGTPILHKDKFVRGKGKFHAVEYRPPAEVTDKDYPLILTTGRYLQQFHTGTMTRRVAGIEDLAPRCKVQVHPADARKYKVNDGDMIRVTTRRGSIEAAADVTDTIRQGVIYMPFHYAEAAANTLTNAALDPVAKIPEFKVCAANIEPKNL